MLDIFDEAPAESAPMTTRPSAKWREKGPHGLLSTHSAMHYARQSGWSIYVDVWKDGGIRAHAHRFNNGSADMPRCPYQSPTVDAAKLAVEFFAMTGEWPEESHA